MPREYLKVKCSVCAIGFDAKTVSSVSKVDTLLKWKEDNMSYVQVRPSYDDIAGWYTYGAAGVTSQIVQPDADLWSWIRKLTRRDERNKQQTKLESYHNWVPIAVGWSSVNVMMVCTPNSILHASVMIPRHKTVPLAPKRNPRKYYIEMFDAKMYARLHPWCQGIFDSHGAIRKIKRSKRTGC